MHATSETQRLQRLAALGDPQAARVLARLSRRRGHAPEWEEAIVARAELYQAVAVGLRIVAGSLQSYDPVRAQHGEAQRQVESAWLELFQLRWQALGLGDTLAALEGSLPASLLAEMSEGHETMLETLRDLVSDHSHATQYDWLAVVSERLLALRAALDEARSGHGRLELVRLEAISRAHRDLVRGVQSLFSGDTLWAVQNLPASCWKDDVAYVVGFSFDDYYAERQASAGDAVRRLLQRAAANRPTPWRSSPRFWLRLSVVADGSVLGPWGVNRVARTWAAVVAEQSPELRSVTEFWSQDSAVPLELLELGDAEVVGAEVVRRLVTEG